MSTALLIVLSSFGAPNDLRVAVRANGDHQAEISLGGVTRRDLRNAEIHVKGRRAILFVPNVQAQALTREPSSGPVQRIKVNPARRGAAIVILARERFSGENDVRLSDTGTAIVIELAGNAVPAVPLPTAPISPVFDRKKGTGLAAVTARATDSTPNSSRFIWLALGLLLAGGAVIALRLRKTPPASGASIDVVAVRALGGKHKLALIETGAERLLVAASDKEVTVLSQLNSEKAQTAYAFAPAPAIPSRMGTPSFAEALAANTDELPGYESPRRQTRRIEARVSEDLTGLLRLRTSKKGAAA